jgi:MHS family proline/betaine transporter-like MFS transporter
VGAVVTTMLRDAAVAEWGWRLPFLLGLLVGLGGLWLRRNLSLDLPDMGTDGAAPALPVREAFRTEWRRMLQLLGVNTVGAVSFYLCFVFATTYLRQTDHIPSSTALDINTAAMLAMLLAAPAAGALSDRIGRKPVLLAAAAGQALLAWPPFRLLHHSDPAVALLGQMGFAVLVGAFAGAVPAAMAAALPQRVHCTALSLPLNLGFGVLGGTTPLVAVYVIQRSHDDLSPAWLLMVAGIVSALCLLGLRETYRAPLLDHRSSHGRPGMVTDAQTANSHAQVKHPA